MIGAAVELDHPDRRASTRPETPTATDRSALRRANVRRFVQGDYAPGRAPGRGHDRARRLHLLCRTTATSAPSTSLRCCCWSARSDSSRSARRSPCSPGASTCRSGPLVGFLVVVGSFFILDESPVASILFGFAADARRLDHRRTGQRRADPVREVHRDRRDADRRTSPCRGSASCSARPPPASSTPTSRGPSRRSSGPSRSPSSCSCSWSWDSSTRCDAPDGAGGCGRPAPTRSRRAGSAST